MPPPAGLVTPCSPSTTIWKLAEIFGLADPLHTRVASGMPVFGSCAGMIMLAGRLVDPPAARKRSARSTRPSGRTHSPPGRLVRDRPVHRGARRRPLPRRVHPRAERVSEDAEVLAAEPRTRKVVAARQGPALATAFHPS
jgi:5'-phosphate synthase pdxT subunit